MEKIKIRRCTFSEIETSPAISQLIAEYESECAINGLPSCKPNFETYRTIEAAGCAHFIGAFDGTHLVGLLVVIVSDNPHYGLKLAVIESFFVLKGYRSHDTGLFLLNAAQTIARDEGAVGMLVSAPRGGALEQVLPHRGYTVTNTIFFKAMS